MAKSDTMIKVEALFATGKPEVKIVLFKLEAVQTDISLLRQGLLPQPYRISGIPVTREVLATYLLGQETVLKDVIDSLYQELVHA